MSANEAGRPLNARNVPSPNSDLGAGCGGNDHKAIKATRVCNLRLAVADLARSSAMCRNAWKRRRQGHGHTERYIHMDKPSQDHFPLRGSLTVDNRLSRLKTLERDFTPLVRKACVS